MEDQDKDDGSRYDYMAFGLGTLLREIRVHDKTAARRTASRNEQTPNAPQLST
jgi:hypothetical protein